MELMIVYILAVYFGIGAIAIFLINRRKDRDAKTQGWMKYFVYLFIVLIMLISMNWKFVYSGILIVIIGTSFFELFKVWLKEKHRKLSLLVISLLIFCLVSSGFIFLAIATKPQSQMIIYTIVFAFDGFSQISGQLFGKRQIVPKISPGKTVGGLAGGLIAALITGSILLQYRNIGSEVPVLNSQIFIFLLSFLIALAAFSGDLLASVYKRKTGVKDYSSLIPGHGGMLDRFDSFIAAGAVVGILELTGILNGTGPTLLL